MRVSIVREVYALWGEEKRNVRVWSLKRLSLGEKGGLMGKMRVALRS